MRMDSSRLTRIDELLEKEIADRRLPGAVYAVGIGGDILRQNAMGYAENLHGVVREMTQEHIFDLASLTKVCATLPSILALLDDGVIRLKDPVARYIPEFAKGQKNEITITHLLTHTSGLPSHRQYYKTHTRREDIIRSIRLEPLEHRPGECVVYSDLGFVLLAEIIQQVTSARIDEFTQTRVFAPLGMTQTKYCPNRDHISHFAATEDFPGIGVKVGLVHDENTAAMGGISGHAGLFSTLADIVRYVQMWVGIGPAVLSPAARRVATTCHTPKLDGRRGLGFVCRGDSYDHMGDMWPATAVGHTGFTGTSLAFDPVSKLWAVLLTNDVHYGRENRTIISLRARVHNVIASAILE